MADSYFNHAWNYLITIVYISIIERQKRTSQANLASRRVHVFILKCAVRFQNVALHVSRIHYSMILPVPHGLRSNSIQHHNQCVKYIFFQICNSGCRRQSRKMIFNNTARFSQSPLTELLPKASHFSSSSASFFFFFVF